MEGSTWQYYESFTKTNLHMLEHELLCDVTLLAGETKEAVKCHKFMLASRSPVFHVMFCGALPETSSVVEIPDIECDILQRMLQFIYSGDVNIGLETVVPLLYTAKKYDLFHLHRKCVTYLERHLATDNVCVILEQAILFEEEQLMEQCLQFLSQNTSDVFETEEFRRLSPKTLGEALGVDKITCQEIDVYQACKAWARQVCLASDKDAKDFRNLREALGDLIYLIRFPAMDPELFCHQVASEDILTAEEKNDIYHDLISRNKMSRFSSKLRSAKQLYVERFFEASGNWNYTGKQDGISFKVSKPCKLVAIGFYLPNTESSVKGPLDIFAGEDKVAEEYVNLDYKLDVKYEYIYLQNKLHLRSGTVYSMCVRLAGAPTYRGIGDKGKQSIDGLGIEFLNLCIGRSDNSTNVQAGQFHGVVIELKHGL